MVIDFDLRDSKAYLHSEKTGRVLNPILLPDPLLAVARSDQNTGRILVLILTTIYCFKHEHCSQYQLLQSRLSDKTFLYTVLSLGPDRY